MVFYGQVMSQSCHNLVTVMSVSGFCVSDEEFEEDIARMVGIVQDLQEGDRSSLGKTLLLTFYTCDVIAHMCDVTAHICDVTACVEC